MPRDDGRGAGAAGMFSRSSAWCRGPCRGLEWVALTVLPTDEAEGLICCGTAATSARLSTSTRSRRPSPRCPGVHREGLGTDSLATLMASGAGGGTLTIGTLFELTD